MFKADTEDKCLGILRAWAGDVGASLRTLPNLVFFGHVLFRFARMAGLVLNRKKYILIITRFLASDANIELVRQRLSHLGIADYDCMLWG